MEHTLSEKIMHQLHIAHNLLRRRKHPRKGAHGHHTHEHDGMVREHMRAQRHLLAILQEKNGQSQKELAEALHIRPSSLSELLGKLEQSGFIVKKNNTEDKRVTDVFLTEEGKASIAKIKQMRQEFVEETFQALTDEEKQTFLNLLAKLNLSLEEKQAHADTHHHHKEGSRERFCHRFAARYHHRHPFF